MTDAPGGAASRGTPVCAAAAAVGCEVLAHLHADSCGQQGGQRDTPPSPVLILGWESFPY